MDQFATRTILLALLAITGPALGNEDGILIDSAGLRLNASANKDGLAISVYDESTGREMLADTPDPRWFSLEFAPRDNLAAPRTVVTDRDARQVTMALSKTAGTKATISFSGFPEKEMAVDCTVAGVPGEPALRWRLNSTFPPSLALVAVRFPLLTWRAPLGEGEAAILGATKGGVYLRPSDWKTGQAIMAGPPGSMQAGFAGHLAAQFGAYYDQRGGVYVMAEDSLAAPKAVFVSRQPSGLALGWCIPCFATREYHQGFDFVTGLFKSPDAQRGTDWRDAADRYKAWATTQPWCAKRIDQRKDLPEWLRQGPAMVRFTREWLSQPEQIERWLTGYWRKDFPAGTPLIIAYWGWEREGTWVAPDYLPPYPSAEQFRQLIAAGRSVGGHAFLWPSGYHYTLTYDKRPDGRFSWDDRRRFQQEFASHAICAQDGKILLRDASWLRGGQNACLCPGDRFTVPWFSHIASNLVREGAELVQVDQVVSGTFPPCYSTAHGHTPGYGTWMRDAFHRQLQDMAAECRKVNPQAVIGVEEPAEWFLPEVGIQDYRDWEVLRRDGVEPASVFNYLYHEYVPTFQSNPRADQPWLTAWCIVTGQMPHLVPTMNTGPGPLLLGGDFETWGEVAPRGWEKVQGYRGRAFSGRASRDTQVRHAGQASLRLENRSEDEIVQVSQNARVGSTFRTAHKYRFTAWTKTEGLAQPNALVLAALTTGLKSLGSWHVRLPGGDSDWTAGSATFALPENAELLRVMLQVKGPGRVWVDDVRLEEILSDGSAVEVRRPETPPDHGLMHAWVDWYHGAGRPYLLYGSMLHPPRLETASTQYAGRSFPVLLHSAFRAPDGSEAVVIVNPTPQPQKGVLYWHGRARPLLLAPQQLLLVE